MTNANSDDSKVVNNEAKSQFEIHVGDQFGFLLYKMQGANIILQHTEVPPELEGKGLGGKLASFALTWARDHNLKVVPLCPYVASYINRHPEFEDAVLKQA